MLDFLEKLTARAEHASVMLEEDFKRLSRFSIFCSFCKHSNVSCGFVNDKGHVNQMLSIVNSVFPILLLPSASFLRQNLKVDTKVKVGDFLET
jgi:hypothetical protein